MSVGIGRERQFEVYVGGARGDVPERPGLVRAPRARGAQAMSPEGFAYVAGGAGTEETMRENRAAFERWRIVPRMLRDVSSRDTSVEVLGTPHAEPVRPLPDRRARNGAPRGGRRRRAGGCGRGHPVRLLEPGVAPDGGDARRRWATRRAGSSSTGARRTSSSRASSRAPSGAAARAIVLTLDTTMLGWRIRDLDLAYLPFLRGKGIAQYTSDPVFVEALQETLRQESPPGGRITLRAIGTLLARPARIPARGSRTFAPGSLARRSAASSRRTRGRRSPGTTSRFLRERTRLPILLKGILHPADALAAIEHGMDGVVVSNHGGRQVDGAIATMDALPGDRRGGRRPRAGAPRQRRSLGRRRVPRARPGRVSGRARAALRVGSRGRRRGRRARGDPQPPRRLRPHDGARRASRPPRDIGRDNVTRV